MADIINLYESIEDFIKSRCTKENNKPFKINYHPNNSSANTNNLPLLYDDDNYIVCIIKNNEELNKKEKDLLLLIKESSFQLVIYKKDDDLKTIKCLLLLIINDYIINDKEEASKFEEEKIGDINNEEELLDSLKIFLFDYIKESKKTKDIDLNKILLMNSPYNIRFYNKEKNDKDFFDFMKKIKILESNIQIKIDYSINDVLDELNPKYRENLMDKYFDEMPEEIANLAKKYKNVSFNNEMYNSYLSYKNKPKDEDQKEKDNENKEKDKKEEKEEKEKDNENNEENKEIGSPKKKEKKEKKKKDDNFSSDKKQLFKIK